jgi:CheY-like chemotaxis protein
MPSPALHPRHYSARSARLQRREHRGHRPSEARRARAQGLDEARSFAPNAGAPLLRLPDKLDWRPSALIVDDSPVRRASLSAILQPAGFSVSWAETGLEGVSQALSGRFDLVLMDEATPLLDGLEGGMFIRGQERRRALAPIHLVVIATAKTRLRGAPPTRPAPTGSSPSRSPRAWCSPRRCRRCAAAPSSAPACPPTRPNRRPPAHPSPAR